MASRPLPLPLWDRKAGKLVDEFMDDTASTYESQPQRSLNQWQSFSRDSRRWITTTSTTLITAGLSVTIAWVDAYGP
jgi:hypothetical protein